MRPLFVAVIFSLVAVNISNAITCSGNGDCNANMECKKKSTGCNKGNCVCKPGYSGSDCKRMRKLGETCSSSDICASGGTECSSGKCSCRSGFSKQPSGRNCWVTNTKEIEASCSAGDVCAPGSTCSSSKCQCTSGTVKSSSYPKEDCVSIKRKGKGESCSTSTDCDGSKNLKCKSSKCNCDDDDVWKSISVENSQGSACINKNAKTDVSKGNVCEFNYGSSAKFCSSDLSCIRCPSDSTSKCHPSSASFLKLNIFLGICAIFLGIIFKY